MKTIILTILSVIISSARCYITRIIDLFTIEIMDSDNVEWYTMADCGSDLLSENFFGCTMIGMDLDNKLSDLVSEHVYDFDGSRNWTSWEYCLHHLATTYLWRPGVEMLGNITGETNSLDITKGVGMPLVHVKEEQLVEERSGKSVIIMQFDYYAPFIRLSGLLQLVIPCAATSVKNLLSICLYNQVVEDKDGSGYWFNVINLIEEMDRQYGNLTVPRSKLLVGKYAVYGLTKSASKSMANLIALIHNIYMLEYRMSLDIEAECYIESLEMRDGYMIEMGYDIIDQFNLTVPVSSTGYGLGNKLLTFEPLWNSNDYYNLTQSNTTL